MTPDNTVMDMKKCLQQYSNISPDEMRILCGYPPKPIREEEHDLKLCEVKIFSGDTIIVETIKRPVQEIKDKKSSEHVMGNKLGEANRQEYNLMEVEQGGIMMRHVVPSDNSCLFNSVYFALNDGEYDGQISNNMRQIIATAVQNNPDKYNSAFLGKENLEYCAWILDSNHWGGAIELSILSEHYKVQIAAVDTVSLSMHCFGEDGNYTQRIFLIYDGIHYDPLLLELGNTRQTVFGVDDRKVKEMVMELAKEAKSSRQFTDVANFIVSCLECNTKLHGEKQAMEHAKSTGHVSFGENEAVAK
ncbi:hypothetical protein JTE90_016786 [Oedothorax gibbosus]|nr:hypothetical protein JTE90_016786 [Oedothorax gibbosus]